MLGYSVEAGLLSAESSPVVRVVLGHFFFVYIHPYIDGNGRIGRFLMNAMMAAAGLPWTVIRVENRAEYMQVPDQASAHGNIEPFCKFLLKTMANPKCVMPQATLCKARL